MINIVIPSSNLNLGPKAFSLLEFEMASQTARPPRLVSPVHYLDAKNLKHWTAAQMFTCLLSNQMAFEYYSISRNKK